MRLTFKHVTSQTWGDFETLMETRGSPHYCWCMLWRHNENRKNVPGKAGKKAAMNARVDNGIPIGILGYHDEQPIAWCSIAPRESYRKIGGDETLSGVWSIVCFFVQRKFRNRGISSQLLEAAVDYARANGARHVEAYPVSPEATTYRFMGLVPAFERAGFRFVRPVGSRRNLMVLSLEPPEEAVQ